MSHVHSFLNRITTLNLSRDVLTAFLWMFVCLECFALINAWVLVDSGSSSSMIKYLRREVFVSLVVLLPILLPAFFSRIYSVLLYTVMACFTATNAVHYLFYDTPLASYVVNVVRETHFAESMEFLAQFMTLEAVALVVLVFAVPLPFLVLSMRGRNRDARTAVVVIGVIVLALGIRLANKAMESVVRWNYAADFMLSCVDATREHAQFQKMLSGPVHLPAKIAKTGEPGRVVVIVIGESSGRYHYGLYGYSRPTTPLLERRREQGLLVFEDVLSSKANTIASLQDGLTFPVDDAETQGTLVDVLKAAGYRVVTLSNQPPLGGYDTAASVLLGRADEVRYFNTGNVNGFYVSAVPDGVVVPAFEKSLSYSGDLAVIVHLMGSHTSYAMRSPKDMPRFKGIPDYAKDYDLSSHVIQDINEYDTSIAYTDQVLNALLECLERRQRPSALLYFSDHGEAVYEDGRVRGHAENAGSRFMFEIPFLIWFSPEYARELPGFVENAAGYVSRPWQTNKLVYPIFRLAGIDFDGFDHAGDILSPSFTPSPRIIGGKDYDQLYSKNQHN